MPRPGRRRLKLSNLLKLLVSVGLLAFVFSRMDLRVAGAALGRLGPGTVVAALVLAFVGYAGRAVRWTYLLQRAGVGITHAASYRLTLVGIFYGLITPGRIGELGRVMHLDLPRSRTLPSVVWDRLADVLLLEALAIPSLVVLGIWRGPLFWIYLAVVAATLAAAAALNSPQVLARLSRRAPRFTARLRLWEAGATGMLTSAAFWRGVLAGTFFYALNFLAAMLLLRQIEPASSATFALILPLIILLGNLPIAFGGLGLREQVAALAFAHLGASASVGPVFSLVWFGVITVVPALVGLALAHTRWGGATTAALPEAAGAKPTGAAARRDAAGGGPSSE